MSASDVEPTPTRSGRPAGDTCTTLEVARLLGPAVRSVQLMVDRGELRVEVQQVLPLTAPDRLPQEAVDALNQFSTKLTTQDLIDLNRKVSGDEQQNPADAAKQWLKDNGYDKAS